jgi:hypothetical protein
VDPVPYPLLLRKSGSAGNKTRTSGSVASRKYISRISNEEQENTNWKERMEPKFKLDVNDEKGAEMKIQKRKR